MPPTPTHNEVSWQSAFWALVPIAVNSMTQPSGEIFSLPSKYSFALRSSPFICAFDALAVLLQFLYLSITLRSPRKASRSILAHRFRAISDDDHDDRTGSLEDLKKNTIFRLALFVLGVLPQVIKLYAMQGVPWTQVWASIFLGSFVLLECLVLLRGKGSEPHTQGPSEEENDWSVIAGFAVICSSMVFAFYFFTVAVFTFVDKRVGDVRWPFLLGYAIIATAYCAVMITPSRTEKHEGPIAILGATLAAPFMLLGSATATVYLPISFAVASCPPGVGYSISLGASVLSALFISLNTLYRLLKHFSPGTAKHVDFSIGTGFLLLNLSSALLYYGLKYDPQGTVKPSWTEQLG